MGKDYSQLSIEERTVLASSLDQGLSRRAIARLLNRSSSTILREVNRNKLGSAYRPQVAHNASQRRRTHPAKKLTANPALWTEVLRMMSKGWSPQQVAGMLKKMHPAEVESRAVPGHWEGDLIKGKYNRSAVGTLVERTSRYVILVKLENATAPVVHQGFVREMKAIPPLLRKSLTYDRGKEMANHKQLAADLTLSVYFADPHAPWQRGSNENANGLIRDYLPKGSDLSVHSQEELNEIAERLNTRPRKKLNFNTPKEVYEAALHGVHINLIGDAFHA